MNALTVRQPYATLIMIGAKPFEFRSWRLNYRGPLAIHAAAALDPYHAEQWKQSSHVLSKAGYAHIRDLPLGAVLGVANLVDCVPCSELDQRGDSTLRLGKRSAGTRHCGDYDPTDNALVLENPRLLPVPFHASGKLGIWRLPPEIEHELRKLL